MGELLNKKEEVILEKGYISFDESSIEFGKDIDNLGELLKDIKEGYFILTIDNGNLRREEDELLYDIVMNVFERDTKENLLYSKHTYILTEDIVENIEDNLNKMCEEHFGKIEKLISKNNKKLSNKVKGNRLEMEVNIDTDVILKEGTELNEKEVEESEIGLESDDLLTSSILNKMTTHTKSKGDISEDYYDEFEDITEDVETDTYDDIEEDDDLFEVIENIEEDITEDEDTTHLLEDDILLEEDIDSEETLVLSEEDNLEDDTYTKITEDEEDVIYEEVTEGDDTTLLDKQYSLETNIDDTKEKESLEEEKLTDEVILSTERDIEDTIDNGNNEVDTIDEEDITELYEPTIAENIEWLKEGHDKDYLSAFHLYLNSKAVWNTVDISKGYIEIQITEYIKLFVSDNGILSSENKIVFNKGEHNLATNKEILENYLDKNKVINKQLYLKPILFGMDKRNLHIMKKV